MTLILNIKNITCKKYFVLLLLIGFMQLYSHSAQAQSSQNGTQSLTSKAVSGVVMDNTNAPIVGATISVRGESRGTISDQKGQFSLEVPADAVLQISFMGFDTKNISVVGINFFSVSLDKGSLDIEEMVVVGFATQKKVNLTGSVGMTDSKAFESRGVTTAAQALQGVIPGFNVKTTGGGYEHKPDLNVRGIGTISDGSSGAPLILIDGLEGDLTTINPQDIESVSVLKDAASSSIYGSRAPFGVILVTTKSGSKGKMKINYNNSFRDRKSISTPEMADSYSFALYRNDSYTNNGNSAFFSNATLQRILDYQKGVINTVGIVDLNNPSYWADFYENGNANVDWYKEVYKKSEFAQEHSLSISGGTDNISYYFSAAHLNQDGILKIGSEGFIRNNIAAKVRAKVSDKITFTTNTRFTREEYHRPTVMNQYMYFMLARRGFPNMSPTDDNGYYYDSPSVALSLAEGGDYKLEKDYLNQQFSAEITPLKGWKITGEYNFKTISDFNHTEQFMVYNHKVNGDPYVYTREINTDYVREHAYKDNYDNFNLFSDYSFSVGDHNIKVLGGFQSEAFRYRNLTAQRNGIILNSKPVLDLTSGTDPSGKAVTPSVNGKYEDWASAGFFGRANYEYKNRYMVEANIRYDGSSRFRKESRWVTSPSVSAGWNIANEEFFAQARDYVSVLKLRASWGTLANQNTSSYYPTYLGMGIGTANGSWLVNGSQPNTSGSSGLVSSSLSWEDITVRNIGVDFAAFGSRLTGSYDLFVRDTKNMIGPAPEMPAILGTAVPKSNNTELQTYGFELQLKWKDKLENGIGYSIGFNLSDSRTKIKKYPNPTNSIGTYREGAQIGDIWGYTTLGIAKSLDEMNTHLASLPNGGQNALGSGWNAGDIMYQDTNGDGKIDGGAGTINDHGDRKVIGNDLPRFLFGLNLEMSWKGFDAYAFFQGVMKRDYFQGGYHFWGANTDGHWGMTTYKEHLDYFRGDASHPLGQNLDSYYPRPEFSGKNNHVQTRYLQNAAYIRLKTLQVGYTIPAQLSNKFGIQKLRIFVSGENLWTGTKLSSIFDPELLGIGEGGAGMIYPIVRTLSTGLSLTF